MLHDRDCPDERYDEFDRFNLLRERGGWRVTQLQRGESNGKERVNRKLQSLLRRQDVPYLEVGLIKVLG